MNPKRKLNIAFICDPITDCIAGSFVSTRRFSHILSAMGHKVIAIAARSLKNPIDNFDGAVKIYRFPAVLIPKSEGQLYISFPTKNKIKKILEDEKIDVIHIIVPTPSAYVSIKAARELGIPIVAHSHTQPENLFLHLPKFFPLKTLNKLFYSYLYWLYRQAHVLVHPSEFSREMFGILNDKIRTMVVSNGVDTDIFKKINPAEFLDKFNLNREKKNVLYHGRLHPEKRVDTLIRAVPEILKEEPETHFFITGFGHLDEELKKLARDLGVAGHVTFFGRVSDEDLILAYNAADIFVLPSLAELEGMAVLEAMAIGLPIVIADSKESASRFFVNGNGFLFEPGNHIDLCQKILILLKDHDAREKMGEESFRAAKGFDIRRSAEKLEEIYYSIL